MSYREGSVERSRIFLYVVKCRFQRYFIVQRHTTLTLPIRLWHDLVKKNRKTDNQLLLPRTEVKIEEKEKNKVSTSTADDWLQIICIDSIRFDSIRFVIRLASVCWLSSNGTIGCIIIVRSLATFSKVERKKCTSHDRPTMWFFDF
jgi:hypothetical protein